MELGKYKTKPINVSVVQLTDENLEEVALHFDAKILEAGKETYLKLPIARMTGGKTGLSVFLGNWIVVYDDVHIVRIFEDEMFHQKFDPIPEPKQGPQSPDKDWVLDNKFNSVFGGQPDEVKKWLEVHRDRWDRFWWVFNGTHELVSIQDYMDGKS
jgi:hypothetical protein